MGYDMYRLTKAYSRPEDPDEESDMPLGEYFRLNIWGMGKARELAILGLAQPPIKEYELYVTALEERGGNPLSSMALQKAFWDVHMPTSDDPEHLIRRWFGSADHSYGKDGFCELINGFDDLVGVDRKCCPPIRDDCRKARQRGFLQHNETPWLQLAMVRRPRRSCQQCFQRRAIRRRSGQCFRRA